MELGSALQWSSVDRFGFYSTSSSTPTAAAGQWFFVAETLKYTGRYYLTVDLYVDGSLVGSHTVDGFPFVPSAGGQVQVSGQAQYSTFQNGQLLSAYYYSYFNGSVSDLAVFPSVLSASQISQQYATATG